MNVDSDLNALILDYLTMEGYPQAAAKFSREANLQPMQDDPVVKDRQKIKQLIHEGKVQEAIEELNDLDPEVCELYIPFEHPSTMIRTRVYMHHAYGLRAVDDKQPLFNDLFRHQTSSLLDYLSRQWC